MSILIEELESKKDKYISVEEVITTLAQATDSKPDQALKYLISHNILDHMPMFFIDNYYNFEVSEVWLDGISEEGLKINYFLKADVAKFEPITKHGVFNNRTDTDNNKCFASYLNAFNLGQLTALIMGIDIGDINLREGSAYLRDHNDYPDGFYDQYQSNLESIKAMALANDGNLFNVVMFEASDWGGSKKEEISLTKTTISKTNLITLCKEMGKSFNELIELQTPITLPTHSQTEPDISPSNQIDKQVQAENEQLKKRINELEQQLELSSTISDISSKDYLSIILDDRFEHHAPDLKHAINLWIDLYINGNIKQDSHSNKANQWIFKNTGYTENDKTSTERIKEISSPLRYWSPHRKKEI